jgi:repressor LexA
MVNLRQRTIKVYNFIVTYYKEHDYPPTHREVAQALGISKSNAHYHISILKNLGYIWYPRNSSRAIEFTGRKQP